MATKQQAPKKEFGGLPHSTEAEKALLGSILLDNSCLAIAGDMIRVEDLFTESHQIIFRSMQSLANSFYTVDLVTLAEDLQKDDKLFRVGGPSYVASLSDGVPMGDYAFVKDYCRIVKEKAELRKIIETARAVATRAYAAESPRELIEYGVNELTKIGITHESAGLVKLDQIIKNADMARIMDQGTMDGLSTGYFDLDALTQGLHQKELAILAARPSVGKSALACNIASNVAMKGKSVGFFSLEMSKESLLFRLICSEGRVDSHKVRSGFCSKEDMTRVTAGLMRMMNLPIWIDETSSLSIVQLRSRAWRLKQEHGLDLLIVDYLQLLSAGSMIDGRQKFEKRYLEIDTVTKGLKAIAKDFGIPVLALAQLSRSSEKGRGGKGREPDLPDLRESGAIEQDADVVMFLHPVASEDENQVGDNVAWILRKQRNGPQGRANLVYLKQYTRFENGTNLYNQEGVDA